MKNRLMWLITLLAGLILVAACSRNEAQPQPAEADVNQIAPVATATVAAPAGQPQAAQAAAQVAQPAVAPVEQAAVAPAAAQSTAAPVEPAAASAAQPAVAAPGEQPAVAPAGQPQVAQMAAQAAPTAPNPTSGTPEKYGLVSGSIEDKGFNQLIWQGLQRAKTNFGIEATHVEVAEGADYNQSINTLLQQGVNNIVTVGFSLAPITRNAAVANPGTRFIGVDFPSQTPNNPGLLFDVDEPAFMAGYLAAGMSQTGVVCTYGGRQTPPVLAFMVGFVSGVDYYNTQTGASVQALGWKTDTGNKMGGAGVFANNFTDQTIGRSIATDFADQNCDIIFPVAGAAGLGSAQVAQERGLKVIGVDADLAQTNPDYADVYLTSVLKKTDVMIYEIVKSIETGQLNPNNNPRNNFIGSLANDGVGLAPFHNFDSQIPQTLKDALANLKNQLIARSISTGWPLGKPPIAQPGMGGAAPAAPAPVERQAPASAPAPAEPAPAPATEPATGALSLEMLRNARYQSDWTQNGVAVLTNGEYREPAAPGSAAEIVVSLSDKVAFGRLAGNAVDAAAVVLATNSGGSGVFIDLAIVIDQAGTPVNLANFPLGDRVKVESVAIQNGEVVVQMVAPGPNDPMCCPTQKVTKHFKLGLVEVKGDGQNDNAGVPPAPGPVSAQTDFTGVYKASLPAADSPGRELTLIINADSTAQLSTDYLNGKPPIVEVGNWQDNGDGTFTVTFTGRADGATYARPDTITFGLQGNQLTAVAWDRNLYGSQGLIFFK